MDVLMNKVTQQAMNYAIRSGVALTTSYAIREGNRLLASAPKSTVRDELERLQKRLQHKIHIISPAIDMIELIAARGNTSLESAVNLTREIRLEIQSIAQRLAQAATNVKNTSQLSRSVRAQALAADEVEMVELRDDIRQFIQRLDDAVPLISLAITTSGVTLSTTLPKSVAPSRLLQASTFLTTGDTEYFTTPHSAVQVGPTFTLSIYMLFAGHDRPQEEEDIRETTWKEVIHKARVKLRRVPLDIVIDTGSGSDAMESVQIRSSPSGATHSDLPAEHRHEEFAYQLMIIEDFDDDRMHDFEEDQPQPGPFDDVRLAGIREMIPVHEISKIFYADTSKVLNIGTDTETNHPVLLLKRDVNAVPPRSMVEREKANQKFTAEKTPSEKTLEEKAYVEADRTDRNNDPWRLPPSLDPEWIAFEVYTEAPDSSPPSPDSTRLVPSESLDLSISKLTLNSPSPPHPPSNTTPSQFTSTPTKASQPTLPTHPSPPWTNQIKTSLSLLELLLRLTSLQQYQQQSHLCINDELLNFFLEESASTGAGGDEGYRQAVRQQARRRVGWDPYDESPVKRRGEEYQYSERYERYEGEDGGLGGLDSPGVGVSFLNGANGSARNTPNPNTPGAESGRGDGWQTRSMTQMSDSFIHTPGEAPSPSPSPAMGKGRNRNEWLKRDEGRERKGSPLAQRPSTGRSDEGLGTSPLGE